MTSASSFIQIEFIRTNRGKHRPYRLLRAMVGPGPDDMAAPISRAGVVDTAVLGCSMAAAALG